MRLRKQVSSRSTFMGWKARKCYMEARLKPSNESTFSLEIRAINRSFEVTEDGLPQAST